MLALARAVLSAGGALMLLIGIGLAALGAYAGEWLRSHLPTVVVDARAVGGAAFTLGIFLAVAGAAQLVVASSVRRRGRWVRAGAAVFAALVATFLLACAAAAATEAARDGSAWLLAASLALTAAAIAYAAGAWQLARASVLPAQPPG